MISDLECAQAAADSYTPAPTWFKLSEAQGIYVALRQVAGGTIVCFRGSVTAQDWLRDFEALPAEHPVLGWCEEGFLTGMDDVGAWVATNLPEGSVAVTGHSLGAARAMILAGLLTSAGHVLERLVTFGTPKPGFGKLSRILLAGAFPITCYKNGPDPVADVPLTLPGAPYCKPVVDTPLNVAPANAHDPFEFHHMPLYLQGVASRSP